MTDGPSHARVFVRRSQDGPLVRVSQPLPDLESGGWLWFDLLRPDAMELAEACEQVGAGRAPIESLDEDAVAGVRSGPADLVVVAHSLTATQDRVDTTAVLCVVGLRGLVTVRFRDVPGFGELVEAATDNPLLASGGPDEMLMRLLDISARRYLPLLDELEVAIARLEDEAIAGEETVLGETHALRRDATLLRGVLGPQREALLNLSRLESPVWSNAARDRAAGTYDLCHRVVESLDVSRGMLTGVIEVYRSAVAEHTNEVMKVLTVFAAIVMPLTLIAGIYGMNFAYMPELDVRWAYPALLGLMAVIAVSLWAYFARRGFVGGPKLVRKTGRGLAHLAARPMRALGARAERTEDTDVGRDLDRETLEIVADVFALPWDTSRVVLGRDTDPDRGG